MSAECHTCTLGQRRRQGGCQSAIGILALDEFAQVVFGSLYTLTRLLRMRRQQGARSRRHGILGCVRYVKLALMRGISVGLPMDPFPADQMQGGQRGQGEWRVRL